MRRILTPVERFQTVLSATDRRNAHEALSHIAIMVGILDRPDRWVAAIAALRDARMITANESFFFLELLMDGVVGDAYESAPELRELEGRQKSRVDEIVAAHWRGLGAREAAAALRPSPPELVDHLRLD